MTPTVTPITHGVEIDLVGSLSSWSVRVTQQNGGDLAIVAVNHASGHVALAELLRRDQP